jgi:hypothetical protein
MSKAAGKAPSTPPQMNEWADGRRIRGTHVLVWVTDQEVPMPSRNRVSSAVSLCRSTIRARRGATSAAAVAAPTSGTSKHGVATTTALILGLALGLGACSSSSEEKFASFTGTWRLDPTNSTFALSCSGQNPVSAPLWKEFVFEEGTVSDLIETSGLCQFLFSVNGQVATLSTPDPLTGAAPVCVLSDSSTDDMGNKETDTVMITPTPSQWAFTLGAVVKGQAPKAMLNGGAQWIETFTPATGAAQTLSCTYVVTASLTKIAQN